MNGETECDQCGDIGDWSEHDGICDSCMEAFTSPRESDDERDEDDDDEGGWGDDDELYDEEYPDWH